MDTATLNGSPSEAVEDPLAAHAHALEEMLGPIEARRAQLEAELSDLTGQEEKINGAIESLLGKRPKKAAAKTAAKPTPVAKHGDGAPKGVSQKNLDDVYAVIAQANDPISYSHIQKTTGMTESVVHNALRVLREQERVRIAGVATARTGESGRRGGGKPPRLYAAMPS